jgi:hypothetical protein
MNTALRTLERGATMLLVGALVFGLAVGPVLAQPFNPPSGTLLGVYVYQTWQGLRVISTIPGYSAHGRLFTNDVLMRLSDGTSVYPIRSLWDLEMAKTNIGAYRWAALEYYRPGWGTMYAWVTFTPVGGVAAYREDGVQPQMKAEFKTEQEKPGAREFFHGQGAAPEVEPGVPWPGPMPPTPPTPTPPTPMPPPFGPPGGAQDPSSLFNR